MDLDHLLKLVQAAIAECEKLNDTGTAYDVLEAYLERTPWRPSAHPEPTPPGHSMQPIQRDRHGTFRFKSNPIVCFLRDQSGVDLGSLLLERDSFTDADRAHFAQLLGYSLSDYHELDFVSDASAAQASRLARAIDPSVGGCRDDGCEIHKKGS